MESGSIKFLRGTILLCAGGLSTFAQIENSPVFAKRTDLEIRQAISGQDEAGLRALCDSLLTEIEAASASQDLVNRVRLARVALEESRKVGYRAGEMRALRQIGGVYFAEQDPVRAVDFFEQAIAVAREISDRKAESEMLSGIGYSYTQRGDYTKALAAYIRVRDIEMVSGSPTLAFTLNGIGALHMRLGDYDLAEAAHREALAVAEKTGDRESVAGSYFHLGIISRNRGNYAEALRYYHQSREITDSLATKDPLNYPSASTRRHISGTYFLQGNLRLAIDYVDQALALDERRRDESGIAYSLQMIATIRVAQKSFNTALPIALKTVPMFERAGDADGIARSLTLLGNIYLSTGEYEKALTILNRPLRMREIGGNRDGAATVRIAIAKALAATNRYDEAIDAAEKAAATVRDTGNRELLWQAQSVIGQIRLARNECDEARNALDGAIETIESLRNEVVGGASESSLFFAERVKPYQMLAAMFASQGNFDESFKYTERAKARGLLDSLRIGRNHQPATMTESEKAEENRLRGSITTLNAQIARLTADKTSYGSKLKDFNVQLEAGRTALARFQTDQYATHPEMRIKRGAERTLEPAAASALVGRDSALVEYAVTDEAVLIYVFTKSRDGHLDFQTYRSPIKHEDLVKSASQFRLALAERNLLFAKDARRLYDVLLGPAKGQIKGKTRLMIVPDDGLWELPFQALQSAENRYLLDDVSVSYVPSLTILRELQDSRRVRGSSGLLAFVNPSDPSSSVGFPSLPELERQTRDLQELMPMPAARVFRRADADEAAFKREIVGGASIVHFATHGVLDSSSPLNSYVVLAPNLAKGEDGRLEAAEILGLNMDADLVTLSACETARGEPRLGEGLVGLAWSFMNAGARNVVVSQWKVESASTAAMTTDFYRNLKGSRPMRKADALRQASLRLRRNPATGHPFYWAGFVLVGGSE